METELSYHTHADLYMVFQGNWFKVWAKMLLWRRYCRCWINTMMWWWQLMLWTRSCTCSIKVIKRACLSMVYGLHSMSGSFKLSFQDASEMNIWKEWSTTTFIKASRKSTMECWLTRWMISSQLLMLSCSKLWDRSRNDPRPETPHHSVLSQMDQAICRPLHPAACFLYAD